MLSIDAAKPQPPVVLITRPQGQQQAFSQACTDLGFCVLHLPCLQIRPYTIDPHYLDDLLDTCDAILFTSANAVRLTHRARPFPWDGRQVHAIGAATARVLGELRQAVALVPQAPFNSEAYLQQLAEKTPGSLLIIKGHGGRDLIESTLVARAWRVNTLAVYERIPPEIPRDVVDAVFNVTPPDIVSITSDEILINLWQLCRHHADSLRQIPLVLNSQRCAQLSTKLGFRGEALVANPAGDQGQLRCLSHWKATHFETC